MLACSCVILVFLDETALSVLGQIKIGYLPHDDARVQRRKTMSVLVVCIVMFATFLFSLDPTRPPFFRLLDYAAMSAELASIYMLHRYKSTEALFWVAALAIIAVQYLFLLMNGNIEGDIMAFFVVPVAAVVVFGPERSWSWFWFCIIPLALAPFLDGYLPAWETALAVTPDNPSGSIFYNPHKRNLEPAEGLAMTVGAICLYFLVFSVYKQLLSAQDIIASQKKEIEREHARSETLLANILPMAVANRLKAAPDQTISDDLGAVTILFADIVGFTALSATLTAPALVRVLNTVFSRFDALVDEAGLEKIKTIGDSYMVACGASEPRADHAEAGVRLGLAMQREMGALSAKIGTDLRIRIGLASGPATAGVIGARKPFYDIWGDTVNMASRMESTGEAGRVQIAETTKNLLPKDTPLEARGSIGVKGKGNVNTYFLQL